MTTAPMTSAIDPVTLAVLKGRLEQIADEMDATLYRSAFNPIIAEARAVNLIRHEQIVVCICGS